MRDVCTIFLLLTACSPMARVIPWSESERQSIVPKTNSVISVPRAYPGRS